MCDRQGSQGLGIMIFEGKHAEVGQGIFISDLQAGSPAEQVSGTRLMGGSGRGQGLGLVSRVCGQLTVGRGLERSCSMCLRQ